MLRWLPLVLMALPIAFAGPGHAPAQDEDRDYVVIAPAVTRSALQAAAEWLYQASCTQASGYSYTVAGYDVVPAPETFFYAHATATYYGEPFTHTGPLSSTMQPPGGPPEIIIFAVSDPANPAASLDFGLVEAGTYTFELPGQPVHAESKTEIRVPEDCVPFSVPAPPGWTFPQTVEGSGAFTNGNCDGFASMLRITLGADGTLLFVQPSTGDVNTGFFWPNHEGYEFVVFNLSEPEAYVGEISPDLRTFQGQAFWKSLCQWEFSLVDAVLLY